jgi:flagellar motor switch protein FliN/FliY
MSDKEIEKRKKRKSPKETSPPFDEDFTLDEELEESFAEEEELSEEEKKVKDTEEETVEEESPQAEEEEEAVAVETKRPEEILLTRKVPLAISVEIGQFHMPISKLMQLGPGSTIELNRRPEQGVDLILFGKKIATGELVQIGDVLGIRILDIGA